MVTLPWMVTPPSAAPVCCMLYHFYYHHAKRWEGQIEKSFFCHGLANMDHADIIPT